MMMKCAIEQEGVRLGVELVEGPTEVLRACRTREHVWHRAVPTA